MFPIDEKIDEECIRQFASQAEHIPEEYRKLFDKNFEGDKSLEFYRGLLEGYSNSYTIVQPLNPQSIETQILSLLVAYVADKIVSLNDDPNRVVEVNFSKP